MSHYRIYLLDRRGHFARVVAYEAASDEEALQAAAALDHPHGTEVWDHGRRVSPIASDLPHPAKLDAPAFGQASPEAI